MKRPSTYIIAVWTDDQGANTEQAVQYCRTVYETGFSPVCPLLYLHLFLGSDIPEEHKSGIDTSHDVLQRAHMLVTCGDGMAEDVKSDITVAGRLNVTAITPGGVLTVKGQDREARRD